jgi:P27 family predicted phage terminase small subunit
MSLALWCEKLKRGGSVMSAGRKRKPAAAHVAEGNKSKLSKAQIEELKAAEDAIKPASDNIVKPDWLDKTASDMFDRIVIELTAVDLVTNVDVYALAIAADSYSQYVKAAKGVNREGQVLTHMNTLGAKNKVANPRVGIAQKYATQFKSFCSEFGLSPAARSRLARPVDPEGGESDDKDLD